MDSVEYPLFFCLFSGSLRLMSKIFWYQEEDCSVITACWLHIQLCLLLTAHYKKCAMHTKESVYCDNDSTLNLCTLYFFLVWGTTPLLVG